MCSLSTLQAFAQDLSFFRARVATQPHERRVSVWNLSPMHRTSDRLLQEIPRRARGSAFCAAIRQNLRQNKEGENFQGVWRHSFSPEGEAHRVEPGYRPAARNGAGTLKTSPSAPQPDSTSVITIVRDFCRSLVHVIRLI